MIKKIGIKDVDTAIREWRKNKESNVEQVINICIKAMRENAEVIVPVDFLEWVDKTGERFIKACGGIKQIADGWKDYAEGDVLTLKEDTRVMLQRLPADDGKFWYVCFTKRNEKEKGPKSSSMKMLLSDIAERAYRDENSMGLIINPFNNCIAIPQEVLDEMLDLSRPLTEDEMNLDMGSDAYQRGDFVAAVKYYILAAEAGNVTAISNLGYCHYYGRSIPVNKEKARLCWEKAAVLGDICAIYKLADMFRNGDLPKDMVFARKLYMEAYSRAKVYGNIYNFPDACLRILKCCKDYFSPEEYQKIAQQAVDGFKARIEDGDNYTGKLYQEALEILNEIQK